ncbi:MAG: hypothetical protein RLZZ385_2177 [Pseudomonadota bacterium]|jgi:cell division protein ZapB
MSEDRFQTLSDKIDTLIDLCSDLKRENQLLKANEHHWTTEKQHLMEKHRETKSKLESILLRLKSLEEA